MIAVGIGRLRLSSADFWALTPTELLAAARPHRRLHTQAPSRAELAALMARYPDSGAR